jgi:apolipoprotein N-acyltransferase
MNIFSSLIVTIILISIISTPYALIGLFHKSIRNNGFYNLNIIALIFLLAEYIKSIILGGFPWLLIGHSQNASIFNYIYPILGSYFVTYLCVLISAFFYKTLIKQDKKYIYLSSIFLVTYLLYPANIKNHDEFNEKTISYSIYQPNIYPDQSYNPKEHKKISEKYINYIRKKDSTDITILPETITPYVLMRNNDLLKEIIESSNDEKIIIAGFFTQSKDDIYNSMVVFSDNIALYNKRKLVPFGEYTPWYDTLIKLSQSLAIPLSNITHGSDEQDEIYVNGLKILPIICFESTFPNIIESSIRNEIIINISNDSWFGDSLAPHQHLQITQVRALEFNRYILRATNTGISAVINNNGVIIDQISNNSEGELNGLAHVRLDKSIYSQFGDLGILMLLFLSLLFKLYKKPKRL